MISRFIDDLCTINVDGEFSSSNKFIYPKQLQLKLEHQEEHAKFLNLDIIYLYISVFIYLTKWTSFLSLLHVCTNLLSNISSSILLVQYFQNIWVRNRSPVTKNCLTRFDLGFYTAIIQIIF